MSKTTTPSLMPEIGSRAHRVLVELSRHRGAVKEEELMAAHGLDFQAPTIWRQGSYRQLVSVGLILKVGEDCWDLTPMGRRLMDDVEDRIVGRAVGSDAGATKLPEAVQPRVATPFKPLTARPSGRPIREGAYDYRDIPSLHSTLTKASEE